MSDKKRIIVVDDERMCRDLFFKILRQYDYDVDVAQNGEEALELFGNKHYDLLITDIKMPGISGIGLVKKIWSIHPDTKVIIITGNQEMGFYLESISIHGVLEYLLKPIRINELIKILVRFFSKTNDSFVENQRSLKGTSKDNHTNDINISKLTAR